MDKYSKLKPEQRKHDGTRALLPFSEWTYAELTEYINGHSDGQYDAHFRAACLARNNMDMV